MAHVHHPNCYHGGRHRRPLADRFWPRVKKGEGCWEWQGGRNRNGYGTIARGAPVGGSMGTHRAAWLLAYGSEPTGMVLHRCDNPPCVRPDHLFLGDARANAHDRATKGRGQDLSGERNGRAKLTWRDVELIRRLYASGSVTQKVLASTFGVSPALVSMVVTGRNWRV